MKNLLSILSFVLLHATAFGQNLNTSPLKIDGYSLFYQTFSLATKGTLTLQMAEENAKKTPFKIYIQRGDKVINVGASSNKKVVSQIEIADVLKYSKYGDYIIIEAADKSKERFSRALPLRDLILDFFNSKTKEYQEGC